jgi:hypothetical protein
VADAFFCRQHCSLGLVICLSALDLFIYFSSSHIFDQEKKGIHLTHNDFDIISGANIMRFLFFISLVLDLEASHFHTSIEFECENLCVPDSGG